MLQSTRQLFVAGMLVWYLASMFLLTLGFFIPIWLGPKTTFTSDQSPTQPPIICYNLGMVSGDCRYPFNSISSSSRTILQTTFYLVLTGSLLFLTSALLLGGAVFFKLANNPVYMSTLSISFGVLLPAGGILLVSGATYLKIKMNAGFSCYCCLVAGCCMLVFYLILRIYDSLYKRERKNKSGNFKKMHVMSNHKVRDEHVQVLIKANLMADLKQRPYWTR